MLDNQGHRSIGKGRHQRDFAVGHSGKSVLLSDRSDLTIKVIDLEERTLSALRENNDRDIGWKGEFAKWKSVLERLRVHNFLHCPNVSETCDA